MNVEPQLSECVCHILPNYPPASWFRKRKLHANEIVKCVYVGSLSLTDTYVLEFCQWIAKQHGKVLFDIYSFNFHKNTLDAMRSFNAHILNFTKRVSNIQRYLICLTDMMWGYYFIKLRR